MGPANLSAATAADIGPVSLFTAPKVLKWACEMSSAAYLSILGSKAGLCIYLYAYDVMHA
jgi:hypothetical protein